MSPFMNITFILHYFTIVYELQSSFLFNILHLPQLTLSIVSITLLPFHSVPEPSFRSLYPSFPFPLFSFPILVLPSIPTNHGICFLQRTGVESNVWSQPHIASLLCRSNRNGLVLSACNIDKMSAKQFLKWIMFLNADSSKKLQTWWGPRHTHFWSFWSQLCLQASMIPILRRWSQSKFGKYCGHP